ncbi:hypothetical protein SAMN03159343_3486 [Klenkia marina]|uniref:Uncharacterized protein n=1 Tax=Klenkia marina TaxID=1960309 RepID=A0A1G4YTE1_9ACTN|nr:hypothetical protein [Klenkia marina]SCX56713.1 hypothetical protein SAMN03159343_3486 [Klenkia marina]
MTTPFEPASVVAARQLATEAHEAHRSPTLLRTRAGARRVAVARARRDAAAGWTEVPVAG